MITFRAEKNTELKLDELARKLGKTRTQVIREALDLYLEGHRPAAKQKLSSGRKTGIDEFIGVWDGPTDSSVNTGTQFGDLLESRKARRG